MVSQSNNPLISIALVTYNCGKSFGEAIESVIRQQYLNKEIIVIDGGSDERTLSVIKRYKGYISVFISEPDDGIYDAMNKALRLADGDYIIFLGSDDHFIGSNVLGDAAKKLTDRDAVYYGNVMRPLQMDIYCKCFTRYKLAVKNICHQCIFYPKVIYKRYSYDTFYPLKADYAYNIQLWRKRKFKYLPMIISYFNDNGESANNADRRFEKDRRLLVTKNLGWIPYIYSVIYHFFRNIVKR